MVQTSTATLHRCYEEPTNPMEIRLAAMDTVKKLACASGDGTEKESLAKAGKEGKTTPNTGAQHG